MNWFAMMFNLETSDGDLNESAYNDLMKHLTPEVFFEFLRDIGLTADDAKSFLIKTLAKVETDSDTLENQQ